MTHTLRYSKYKSREVDTELNRSNAKSLFVAVRSGDLETMKQILQNDEIGLANICLAENNGCDCGDIVETT